MSALVETYSGHRLHERPLRFCREGVWRQVVRIVDRWQEPQILGFKVTADDGQEYILEYNKEQDIWKILNYQHLAKRRPPV